MQYFSSLPKVVYFDKGGNSTVYTNIMSRANIKLSLLNNPLLFYTYDVQDEDTPEIVAYKYYGDSYRYWIVLYCNQILDPQWEWPLSRKDFDTYVNNKYDVMNINSAHHHEKIITQYEQNTLTTTTNVVTIDYDTYLGLMETTNTYNLPTGPVTVSVTKREVTNYQYELEKNESKRNIKILNKLYANQLETEFKSLMR